jgi:hypothetical protein
MAMKLTSGVWVGMAAVFSLATGFPVHPESVPVQEAPWASSVSLTLGPQTQQIAVGMPAAFKLVMKNTTAGELADVLRRPRSFVRMTFKSATRTFQTGIPDRWAEGTYSELAPDAATSLRRGEDITYQFFLHELSGEAIDARSTGAPTPDFLFKQPEQFDVTLSFIQGGVQVNSSNTVTLNVVAPGAADLPVLAALNALSPSSKLGIVSWVRPTGLADVTGAQDLKNASGVEAESMRTLLNNNPTSVYAPFIRFHVAMFDFKTSVTSDPLDQTRTAVIIDQGGFNRAVLSFDQLAGVGDDVLAPQALGQLALQQRTADVRLQRDGARSLDKLRRKFGTTDYYLGEWLDVGADSLK